MKQPLFNAFPVACICCRGIIDIQNTEIIEDLFSYLCVECMNKYAKTHEIIFDE